MRKYAYLKKPVKCSSRDYIYKIMLYEYKQGVYLFEYCSPDAVRCSYDQWYADVQDVYDDWNDEIDENGWIDIDNPQTGQSDDLLEE